MQQIIDDLRGLETEHGGSDLALTRGEINRAIAAGLVPDEPGRIRSIMDDRSYEDARARLIKALMDDNEFLDHVAGNRVTFGMINPHVNLAKLTDKTDDEVADMIMGEIKPPLEVLASRHTHMPLSVSRRFHKIHRNRPFFDLLTKSLSRGAITGLILSSSDGNPIRHWVDQIGPPNPQHAAPYTLMAQFATKTDDHILHATCPTGRCLDDELNCFRGLI